MAKRLKIDNGFIPCAGEDGDEFYVNGIFEFNISKMIAYIQENPDTISLETVLVEDFAQSSSIDESHMDSVDISKPVIMAEIAPGRYNLIDGNHRMEKARRMGVKSLPAYKFNVDQHIKFLTDKRGYVTYVEFWNDKLKYFAKVAQVMEGAKNV